MVVATKVKATKLHVLTDFYSGTCGPPRARTFAGPNKFHIHWYSSFRDLSPAVARAHVPIDLLFNDVQCC